jgi:hypothetical protein
MENKPIAIIMVNLGNYEHYREFPNVINYHLVDWYYFTDDTNLKSNFWKISNINNYPELSSFDNRLKSKYIKMLTHKILPNYQYYFWIDGSFPITNLNLISDLFNFINQKQTLILYSHNSRWKEKTLNHEVERCSKLKSINLEKLNLQLKNYQNDFYPNKRGFLFSSGIIFRINNNIINQLMELWFQHNQNFTTRDQISLPFVLWKLNIFPSKIIKENINLNSLVGKKQMKSRKNR